MSLRDGALGYAAALRNGDGFGYRLSEEATEEIAIAVAVAVLLRRFLGDASLFDETERDGFIASLRGWQNERGWFEDPVDYANPTQSQPLWALKLHRSRHILWALDALGARATHPFAWLETRFPSRSLPHLLRAWLSASDPDGGIWALSNRIMDIAVHLDFQARWFDDVRAKANFEVLLDVLDETQDPETGFWLLPGDDLRGAMAGAMHFYPLYWRAGREPAFYDLAVESTLALQQSDGLFAYQTDVGGDQCLDFDAALILVNGWNSQPALRGGISRAMEKLWSAVHVNRLPCGGFSDSRQPVLRHWATQAAAYRSDGASLWDTLARLLTLGMAWRVLTGQDPPGVSRDHHLFDIWSAQEDLRQNQPPAGHSEHSTANTI